MDPVAMKRGPSLTSGQRERFERHGFLVVTEPILPADQVHFVRQRIDQLYDHWNDLPRRFAVRRTDDGQPPLIAKIHRVGAIDRVLAHSPLVETCREMARSILGRHDVWCGFDCAIYKYPGAEPIEWHRDASDSLLGRPKRAVHFWIPLNEHPSDAGSIAFAPGSHRNTEETPPFARPFPLEAGAKVSGPQLVGNFSLHTPLTLHSSDPNLGREVRKTLTLEFSAHAWSALRQGVHPLVGATLTRGLDLSAL